MNRLIRPFLLPILLLSLLLGCKNNDLDKPISGTYTIKVTATKQIEITHIAVATYKGKEKEIEKHFHASYQAPLESPWTQEYNVENGIQVKAEGFANLPNGEIIITLLKGGKVVDQKSSGKVIQGASVSIETLIHKMVEKAVWAEAKYP